MSAGRFVVCYGLRQDIGPDRPDELTLLEERRHPWFLAARRAKLRFYWGESTTRGHYFVLVGYPLWVFGWENDTSARHTDAEVSAVTADARERLAAAGFADEPAWHYQFEPDY